ncbi:Carbonic anhydrase 15 [Halotydeus destructor]|nr:Carbonic anhydrase 15 [Halotydeus destructor]
MCFLTVKSAIITVVVLFISLLTGYSSGAEWEYDGSHGQDHWSKLSNICSAGRAQSPIDIERKKVKLDPSLKIDFKNYDKLIEGQQWRLSNNGHTAQLTLNKSGLSGEQVPSISGTALGHSYEFIQLHFHWHTKDDKGSEHAIDGNHFALEMHYVHMNTKYEGIPQAKNNKDGLAVLSTLFEIRRKDNRHLEAITSSLSSVVHSDTNVTLSQSIALADMLSDNVDHFYKYGGSLTTPPCSEAVTWLILSDISPISDAQMDRFRKLMRSNNGDQRDILIQHNVRDLQKLRKRDIFYSSTGSIDLPSSLLAIVSSLFTLTAARHLLMQ